MGAQHTPGPWHVGGKATVPIIYGPDGFAVADATVFHGTFKEGESEANARLIAAAPELLEALEALDAWHDATDQGTVFDQMRRVGELYEAARVAIAKARGHHND